MKTPDEQLEQDAGLADTSPEFDRRAIRCRCQHSIAAHPRRVRRTDPLSGFVDELDLPCGRCSCSRFSSRPAPWTVRARVEDPVQRAVGLISWLVADFWPTPRRVEWVVTSPRGEELIATPNRKAALSIAHSMAALDEMLARVDRIERQRFGNHPALRADARPGDVLMQRGGEIVAVQLEYGPERGKLVEGSYPVPMGDGSYTIADVEAWRAENQPRWRSPYTVTEPAAKDAPVLHLVEGGDQ